MGGLYSPPSALCPYFEVDPVRFEALGGADLRRNDLDLALDSLRVRTGEDYFLKAYPPQGLTLSYSSRSFPAYRFVMPEVISEDWLGIVDWGKKVQRDHVLHQPLCGYIVLRLLRGDGPSGSAVLSDGSTLLDTCVEQTLRSSKCEYIIDFLRRCGLKDETLVNADNAVAKALWRILFVEAAYLAAVFHDVGYPWQYAERLQTNLDGVNTPAVRQNRSATEVVARFGHRLVVNALRGWIRENPAEPSDFSARLTELVGDGLSRTHGLPGALAFLYLNDCVRAFPDPLPSPFRLLCVEWAAAAIMMHDSAGLYWGPEKDSVDGRPGRRWLRLDCERDPLSAVIALVDMLQDFERPIVEFGAGGVGKGGKGASVSMKYRSACKKTVLELEKSGELRITYHMANDRGRAFKASRLGGEMKCYFDPPDGYLDLNGWGVTSVSMTAVV